MSVVIMSWIRCIGHSVGSWGQVMLMHGMGHSVGRWGPVMSMHGMGWWAVSCDICYVNKSSGKLDIVKVVS